MQGGQPRFGMRYEAGMLVEDEHEQKVIAQIVSLRAEPGPVSYNGIAGMLNSEGKFRRGQFWSMQTVRSVYHKAIEAQQGEAATG